VELSIFAPVIFFACPSDLVHATSMHNYKGCTNVKFFLLVHIKYLLVTLEYLS